MTAKDRVRQRIAAIHGLAESKQMVTEAQTMTPRDVIANFSSVHLTRAIANYRDAKKAYERAQDLLADAESDVMSEIDDIAAEEGITVTKLATPLMGV